MPAASFVKLYFWRKHEIKYLSEKYLLENNILINTSQTEIVKPELLSIL